MHVTDELKAIVFLWCRHIHLPPIPPCRPLQVRKGSILRDRNRMTGPEVSPHPKVQIFIPSEVVWFGEKREGAEFCCRGLPPPPTPPRGSPFFRCTCPDLCEGVGGGRGGVELLPLGARPGVGRVCPQVHSVGINPGGGRRV